MMVATDTAPTITVCGEPEPFTGQSLEAVLSARDVIGTRRGIAVALNAEVVPRSDWTSTSLAPGDRIEIVQARAGG